MGRKKSVGRPKGKKGRKVRMPKEAVAAPVVGPVVVPEYEHFVHLGPKNLAGMRNRIDELMELTRRMNDFVEKCERIFEERNPVGEDIDP